MMEMIKNFFGMLCVEAWLWPFIAGIGFGMFAILLPLMFIGFYHMKKWMWPWAGVYVLQIAFSMVVWQLSDDRGAGLVQGLVALGLFSALAVVLLRRPTAFNQRT